MRFFLDAIQKEEKQRETGILSLCGLQSFSALWLDFPVSVLGSQRDPLKAVLAHAEKLERPGKGLSGQTLWCS